MPAKENIVIKIGALISVICGIFWCITIIGAIIGIPTIILNWGLFKGQSTNNSWNSGIDRLWSKRDVKLAAIFGFISSLLGGILIIIGEWVLD